MVVTGGTPNFVGNLVMNFLVRLGFKFEVNPTTRALKFFSKIRLIHERAIHPDRQHVRH